MGGSGGERSSSRARAAVPAKPSKLDKLSDEELRKWSAAYGYSDKGTRAKLLDQLSGHADGILDPCREAGVKNLPLEMPPFTLSDIQAAIPRYCFKRSLLKSIGYLLIDLIQIALLGWAATFIGKPVGPEGILGTGLHVPAHLQHLHLPEWAPYVLWPLYIFCQGTVMTGVWVLAHECGHQAFSESEFWNNTFGTVLHSFLLVPYHSWRITHKRHHENTGSCENDEVFAPSTRSDWAKDMLRETPIAQFFGIFIMLTVGWLPGYLVFNATGPAKYRGKNANHFSPTAAFFRPEEYWLIVQSDIAFFSTVGLLGYAIHTLGFATVGKFYLLPLMVVNYHLVLITYLQHTASYLPHFRGKEWNFLRGALCTVDRKFGYVYDSYLHHIVDTHVCHHLFSKMPFYHAQEATEVIKKVVGKYYMYDPSPIASAVYNSFSHCQFIEDDGNIAFYKNVK
jgi:omega-6 fatty acid desaturase (delta-12 desaturase)